MEILLVALALAYNFVNGFQGSGSSVATIISSRAIAPRLALWMTAVAVLFGPPLFGVAVAQTIGAELLAPAPGDPLIPCAALVSAVAWSLLTWFLGIPSSPSHALVGALMGAAVAAGITGQIQTGGVIKVLAALFISPLLGFLAGLLITRLVFFLARNATLKINGWFMRAQFLTGMALALSNGANDAPKGMGMMAMGLMSVGALAQFEVTRWMMLTSALAMAAGSLLGGWRVIRTLGGGFFRIRPADSFTSQVASTAVILSAALLGGPVSTTQVVSSAILGTGAAERPNKVRWGLASSIGVTWLVTIPANMLFGWALYQALRLLF